MLELKIPFFADSRDKSEPRIHTRKKTPLNSSFIIVLLLLLTKSFLTTVYKRLLQKY